MGGLKIVLDSNVVRTMKFNPAKVGFYRKKLRLVVRFSFGEKLGFSGKVGVLVAVRSVQLS